MNNKQIWKNSVGLLWRLYCYFIFQSILDTVDQLQIAQLWLKLVIICDFKSLVDLLLRTVWIIYLLIQVQSYLMNLVL